MNQPIERRSVLQSLLLAPLAVLLPKVAFAAGAENMKPDDPLAKAMQYVEDASKAGPTRTDKTSNCGNCAKYAKCPAGVAACVSGKKTDARAACEIFMGKHVTKGGWCMSWTKA